MHEVLIICYGMGCGGAEKSLISFLNRLPQNKWNVDLIVANPNGMYMSQIPDTVNYLNNQYELENFATPIKLRRKKVCSVRDIINQARWQIGSKFLYKNLPWNEKRWKLWGRYLPKLKKEYDLAISYMNGPTNYYVIDKVIAKKKILWIHNEFEKLDVTYDFEKKYYTMADKVVTISQDCVESFCRVYPDLRSKAMVLENISSPEAIQIASKIIPNDEYFQYKGLKILSIGRLSPQKGYEIAIDAAFRMKESGVEFVWYILGEGELRGQLESLIKEKELTNQIRLVGIKENPYPYIAACDIFAQTSRYEGKSIALDEAKILAKPILVTNYATVGASIVDEINGLIANVDGESVANGLMRLKDDYQLRNKLVTNLKNGKIGNEEEIDKYVQLIDDNIN